MSYYREQLESWLKTIDVEADRVLDVGGAANPVKGRTKSWEVGEYKIMDNGLEAGSYDFEWDLNLDPDKNCLPCNTYEWDIIFCLEVMEYIYNPLQAIKTLSYLSDHGPVFISFPFVYPVHSPHHKDYLRYTRFGIIKLLEEAGFKILEIKGRVAKDPMKLLQFYKSDGMHIKADGNITGYLVKAQKC